MVTFKTISLNETQKISAGCQVGTFSACPKGSQVPFFGCCTEGVDPCKQGCIGTDLQPTYFDLQDSNFTDQACEAKGGGLFYTCSQVQFLGCCTSNPCQNQQYCPFPNLRAAVRTTFSTSNPPVAPSSALTNPSTASKNTTAQSTEQHGLAPGAAAGIGIGSSALLLAIGVGIFFFLRHRKRVTDASGAYPDSSGAIQLEPLHTGRSQI